MNAVRTIGRIGLILLMVRAVVELVATILRITSASASQSESLSYLTGRLGGIVILILLFVWAFLWLGKNRSANSE